MHPAAERKSMLRASVPASVVRPPIPRGPFLKRTILSRARQAVICHIYLNSCIVWYVQDVATLEVSQLFIKLGSAIPPAYARDSGSVALFSLGSWLLAAHPINGGKEVVAALSSRTAASGQSM